MAGGAALLTRRRRMDREEKLKYINRKKIDIKICKTRCSRKIIGGCGGIMGDERVGGRWK